MANHNDRMEARRAAKAEAKGKRFEAHHRWARIGAEKVRLVGNQIRGMPVSRALEVLKFSKKRGGKLLDKVVKSALANAEFQISEQKLPIEIDALHVTDVQVNEGPTLKRWMTRSRGMAYPILRRMCHINATLEPVGGKGGGETSDGPTASVGSSASGAKTKKSKKTAMAGARATSTAAASTAGAK